MKLIRVLLLVIALFASSAVYAQEVTKTPTVPEGNVVEFKMDEAKCLVTFTSNAIPLGGPSTLMPVFLEESHIQKFTGKLYQVVSVNDILYVHTTLQLSDSYYYDLWFLGDSVHYNSNCESSKVTVVTTAVADSFPCIGKVSNFVTSAYELKDSARRHMGLHSGQQVLITGARPSVFDIRLVKKGEKDDLYTVSSEEFEVPTVALQPDASCYKTG